MRSIVERDPITGRILKRGPGRPPREPSGDDGAFVHDPTAVAGEEGAGAGEPGGGTARRGKSVGGGPSGGAKTAGEKTRASLDLGTTIACLQGAHAILAHFGGPHWLLDDKDATTYAKAINNVARHYDIKAAQKTVDWVNLLGMMAFIEGTRIVAGKAARQAAQRPPPRGPAQVFTFSPPNQPDTPPAPAPGRPQTPLGAEMFGPPAPPDGSSPEGAVH